MTAGISANRAGSMNQMPAMMKMASGASLPMVSALTTHDDCLMPRTLIQVSAMVSPAISDIRGRPAASAGQ